MKKLLVGVLVLMASVAAWLGKRARQGAMPADPRLAGQYNYSEE
jgi:hypothetical protein